MGRKSGPETLSVLFEQLKLIRISFGCRVLHFVVCSLERGMLNARSNFCVYQKWDKMRILSRWKFM